MGAVLKIIKLGNMIDLRGFYIVYYYHMLLFALLDMQYLDQKVILKKLYRKRRFGNLSDLSLFKIGYNAVSIYFKRPLHKSLIFL
jgi:hypothetical protein